MMAMAMVPMIKIKITNHSHVATQKWDLPIESYVARWFPRVCLEMGYHPVKSWLKLRNLQVSNAWINHGKPHYIGEISQFSIIFILNSFELIWSTHFGILLLPKSTIFRDTSRHHSMTCAALTDQRKEHGVELVDAQPEKWWNKQKKSDSNGRESVVSLEQDLHGFTVFTLG